MNQTRLLLLVIIGIGMLMLSIGFYLAFFKSNEATPLPLNTEVVSSSTPSLTSQSVNKKEIKVFAASQITDTGIELKKGQTVNLTATGQVNASSTQSDGSYKWVNPDGWDNEPEFNTGRKGVLQDGQPFMALAAKISKGKPSLDDGGWTFIGSSGSITATENGTLYFSVNDKFRDSAGVYHSDWFTNNQGSFTVILK